MVFSFCCFLARVATRRRCVNDLFNCCALGDGLLSMRRGECCPRHALLRSALLCLRYAQQWQPSATSASNSVRSRPQRPHKSSYTVPHHQTHRCIVANGLRSTTSSVASFILLCSLDERGQSRCFVRAGRLRRLLRLSCAELRCTALPMLPSSRCLVARAIQQVSLGSASSPKAPCRRGSRRRFPSSDCPRLRHQCG